MAEIDIAPNFGGELKDGFKPVNAWVTNGIAWLDDIQQFYRERSAIEKEYSQKLAALAKKYFEKKAKKQSQLSVGDTPTVTPGSLESASMTTWTVQLTTLESRAAEHDRFSGQLVANLAGPLQHLQNRYEDLRKSHADYAARLEKERDSTYADLKKTKGKYDSVCQEVENRRKKVEGSFDHGKSKAQTQYQQTLSDMRNTKNTYLIAINVTNKQKERYYHEYVPELLDSLQSLSEARTAALNNFWSTAARTETDMLQRSTQLVEHLAAEIPRNNPLLDSMMFVRHNAAQWYDPPDFAFEPSPVWLDDDVMASDPSSKTFLMNILSKSKSSVGELRRECDMKRREVEGAKRVRQLIREGKDKRDEGEVVRMQFVHQQSLHDAEQRKTTAEVEMSTITSAVGDISAGAKNHPFKHETFRLPTNCDLCGDRIWGLSAKGLICTDCGFTCHTKCELKVPADCPGELTKDQKKAMKSERQAAAQSTLPAPPASNGGGGGGDHRGSTPSLQRSDTMGSMNTLSSGYATSAHRSVSATTLKDSSDSPPAAPPRHRVVAPPPASFAAPASPTADDGQQKGRMLYAYTDPDISVPDGAEFTLLEPDDGSGWIKISTFSGVTGLVPASYADLDAGGAKKKVGPAVAPRRGAKKVKHVEALYAYEPSGGEGETGMQEGERLVLIAPDGGDGWCEVEGSQGRGIVPAAWVREV